MWAAILAFFNGLWTGIRARGAAKAGGELNQGEAQTDAVNRDVATIEGELARTKPVTP